MVASPDEKSPIPNSVVAAVDEKVLATKNIVKRTEADQKLERQHTILDSTFAALLVVAALKFGNPKTLLRKFIANMKKFPNHYSPVFNWQKQPMKKSVAMGTCWRAGIFS